MAGSVADIVDRAAVPALQQRRLSGIARSIRLPLLSPVAALVLGGSAILGAGNWADFDLFWHLENGRLLVERGLSPGVDHLSWSAAGQPVVAFSWPVDALLFLIWRSAGAVGLGLFAALAVFGVLLPIALLTSRLLLRPWLEAGTLVLVFFAIKPYLGARPHLVAAALFGLLVWLIDRPFTARRALAAGVVLGAWANLHGTFEIGFALLAAAAGSWAIARAWRSAVLALGSIGLGALLSLLSPLGPRIWVMPLTSASSSVLARYDTDWASLHPLNLGYIWMALLLLGAVGLGVWRATNPRALAALGLSLPVIQLARFTPFVAPLLGFVLAERAVERWPGLAYAEGSAVAVSLRHGRLARLSWLLLALSLVVVAVKAPPTLEAARAAANQPSIPEAAVDRLLQCGQPAPVWNDYNWGGYLAWRGDASYAVGIDGRLETLYSIDWFTDYMRVESAGQGWQELVQGSPAQYALMPSTSGAPIERLPGWRLVYRDAVATLAARDGALWTCAVPPA